MSRLADGGERFAPLPVGGTATARARAFAVTAPFDAPRAAQQLGGDAYEYAELYRAFRPLLVRLGDVIEVDRPESRLDYTLQQARERGLAVTHISFLPLQRVYLSSMAANVAVLCWGLADVPNADLDNDARNNWVRIADRLSIILCVNEHTRAAFVRAGVRTPLRVVPAPVPDAFFDLPPHSPAAQPRLDGPMYVCPGPIARTVAPDPWVGPTRRPGGAAERVAWRAADWAGTHYARLLQPRTPAWIRRGLRAGARAARAASREYRTPPAPPSNAGSVMLSGVVYASVVDPADRRTNWEDLLSAFLIALRAAEDATLVVALIPPLPLATVGVIDLLDHHHALGVDHRCKLVFVTQTPTEGQMLALARCATYALSASRAEGACLPIQHLLAAARPAVAPQHSALGDYLDAEVGFPVASHAEPTHWATDPSRRLTTTWNRIVWQSLHDQIQASYRVATAERARYEQMARRARERMRHIADAEGVWSRLRDALDVDDRSAAVR